tara:strand:+ start:52515 stop:52934 length:420 start_codon:yes stop_codon:yes gene_type:complete
MDRNFKVLKIDHIAVAVESINSSINIFNLLGMNLKNNEYVDNEKVNVVKINPESKEHTIELLEPSDDTSVIKSFINKKGQGLHHIALEVDNICSAIEYLKYSNIKLIYSEPKIGANNKLITFIHPESTPGILIEICQST